MSAWSKWQISLLTKLFGLKHLHLTNITTQPTNTKCKQSYGVVKSIRRDMKWVAYIDISMEPHWVIQRGSTSEHQVGKCFHVAENSIIIRQICSGYSVIALVTICNIMLHVASSQSGHNQSFTLRHERRLMSASFFSRQQRQPWTRNTTACIFQFNQAV